MRELGRHFACDSAWMAMAFITGNAVCMWSPVTSSSHLVSPKAVFPLDDEGACTKEYILETLEIL